MKLQYCQWLTLTWACQILYLAAVTPVVDSASNECSQVCAVATNDSKPEECAICLNEVPQAESNSDTHCPNGHQFHAECLDDWGKSKANCPTCRAPLPHFHQKYHRDHSLLQAVSVGRIDLMQRYLQEGANVNARNQLGLHALFIAVLKGYNQAVSLLVQPQWHAQVDLPVDGVTALQMAILRNCQQCAKVLIIAGADINAPIMTRGDTILTLAARAKHGDLVLKSLYLVDDYCAQAIFGRLNINSVVRESLENALIIAVKMGNVKAASMLVDRGINLTARDSKGKTALAYTRGRLRLISLARKIRSTCKIHNLMCM